jgi:hypothetical protein
MSPDRKPAPKRASRRPSNAAITRPDPDHPYGIAYFRRHEDDDSEQAVPGQAFLRSCPDKVRATMQAVVTQVAAAPPHRFAGGGYWEAMHGDMTGIYEIRVDGPGRHHYRLFCLLDTEAQGLGPLLVILAGADKPFRSTFPGRVYTQVLRLAAEYRRRQPRPIA